jgi:hypothetical protein
LQAWSVQPSVQPLGAVQTAGEQPRCRQHRRRGPENGFRIDRIMPQADIRGAPALRLFATARIRGGSHQQSFHSAEIEVREPPIAVLPANFAREPSVCSIRMASFHFAIRSERENEPTLS